MAAPPHPRRGFSRESLYDDYTYGGALLFETSALTSNTLKAAFHYRNDIHTETQHVQPDVTGTVPEPDEPWSPAQRERMRAIAHEVFADLEQRGRTGRSLRTLATW